MMEQERYKEQFERYALDCMDTVYTEALRLTGNLPEAENLVQSTYQHAFENFDEFRSNGKAHGWILAILRNEFQEQSQLA